MKKGLFFIISLGFMYETTAQIITPIPKDSHIVPPNIREFHKNPKQMPNLRYLKPQDLDSTSRSDNRPTLVFAEQDNMPILKVGGSMPNMYAGSQVYRMPRYLYDDKKRQDVK